MQIQMLIQLQLTIEQKNSLVALLDAGVKMVGLQAAAAAAILFNMIQEAEKAAIAMHTAQANGADTDARSASTS